MNAFVTAAKNTPYARTENGALTHENSGSPVVDLFFAIGSAKSGNSSRLNAIEMYKNAAAFDYDRAVRTMLWMRDIREGAGRRQAFRDWLNYLEENDKATLGLVLRYVPEFGRWDDLLALKTELGKAAAYVLIAKALEEKNGLCAKWMPRKGVQAAEIRSALGLSPKSYRKLLVGLTSVVETPMCAKEFGNINYSHVPSVASARYRKAFSRNDQERFGAYIEELKKPVEQRDPKVKVNAGAIYPFDVIRGLRGYDGNVEAHAEAQWDALPNYVGEASILPMVDVSESMTSVVQGTTQAMDVSISLGIYLAEKNEGAFKNLVLSFTDRPTFFDLTGTLKNKMNQIHSHKGYNTNLQLAFAEILRVAKANNVPAADMPEYLLVISDMEFDSVDGGKTNFQKAQEMFAAAGYKLPNLVWWNVNARQGNSPVRVGTQGTALVSGFSPAIMKSVLSATEITPESIVDATIMKDRYNFRAAA